MSESIQVLVVDNDPDSLLLLRLILGSRPKYDAVFYDSAAKALAHRPDRPFDVLVTDLHMPGMDGLELAATLRESDPELPVLLVTAHATVDSAVRAVQGSVTDFLPKPLMADTVRAAVDAAARTRAVCAPLREQQGAAARVPSRAMG